MMNLSSAFSNEKRIKFGCIGTGVFFVFVLFCKKYTTLKNVHAQIMCHMSPELTIFKLPRQTENMNNFHGETKDTLKKKKTLITFYIRVTLYNTVKH